MPYYRAVIFDLFYTLINPLDPAYMQNSEYEVLGMSREDFERRNTANYETWAGGSIRDPVEIVRRIVAGLDFTEGQIHAAAQARIERVHQGLLGTAAKNLEMLATLRERGIKTALISNADVIDTWHWKESPLAAYFDATVFSWEVGILKPDPKIYTLALERLHTAGECLYAGDGGHQELRGAKEAGLSTVLTVEYIQHLWPERIPAIKPWADYVIDDITKITELCPPLPSPQRTLP
ncbi:MAG: HAD family hydrolase [Treponema sp.]|jgi:putative hydrolase of the HAD superfamily|nr:HAD family hydrolase [Treponema sp.]